MLYLCSSISGDVVDTFRDRSLDGKMISGKFLYQGLERVWIDLIGDTAKWNRKFGFSVDLNEYYVSVYLLKYYIFVLLIQYVVYSSTEIMKIIVFS